MCVLDQRAAGPTALITAPDRGSCTPSGTCRRRAAIRSPRSRPHRARARSCPLAASASTSEAATDAAPAASGVKLQEVTKDDFHAVIEAAGSKLVVVDCYTEWCVPAVTAVLCSAPRLQCCAVLCSAAQAAHCECARRAWRPATPGNRSANSAAALHTAPPTCLPCPQIMLGPTPTTRLPAGADPAR